MFDRWTARSSRKEEIRAGLWCTCVVLEAVTACGRTQVVVSVLTRRQGSLTWVGGRFVNYV